MYRRAKGSLCAFLLVSLLTMCAGCAAHMPYEAVRSIRRMPYDAEVFNCADKAKLLYKELQANGYEARIVVGNYQGKRHAWVEYRDSATDAEQWRLLDPTVRGIPNGFSPGEYRDYRSEIYLVEVGGSLEITNPVE